MTAIKVAVAAALVSLLGWGAACGDDEAPNGSPSPTHIPEAELPLPDPWELHVAAADGSGETMVYTDDRASGFAWSPDGSQLAIAGGDYESTTVRFVGLDGEESASVTVEGSARRLSWSPDGRYVTTVFDAGTTNSLVALASDGSEQRELLSEPGMTFIVQSGWLPSGELLVERGESLGGGRLLAIDIGSGTSRELSELDIYPDYFGRPAVSPDGRLLAVTVQMSDKGCGSPDNGNAIWTIDLDSGDTTQISPGGYCGGGGIVWSPDGQQIAFSVVGISDESGIFIADVESHEARRLTTGLDQVAAWLEDGTILARRLICTACDAGLGKVVAIDSGSGEFREVTENGVRSDISPSGQIVAARDAIEILDATGAQMRVLAAVEALWRYTGFEWSPDEAHVAYLRFHATGQHVYELNADGSGFGLVGVYEVQTAKLSPDGTRVAYLDNAGSTKDKPAAHLLLANRDGSDPVDVGVTGVIWFAWSPAGGLLLFTAVEAPGAEASIYLVNDDGSGLRELETSSPVPAGSAAGVWAPNQKLVAFVNRDIQVLDVDTGEVTMVAEDVGKGSRPAWSWDSTKLVYGRGFFGRNGSEIVIANADGSGSTTILSDDRYGKNGLVFSPDGSRIAFFTSGPEKATRLVVADVDGSDEQVIAEGALLASTSVAWSPDGQWIAVAMGLDGRRGLFLINPDGLELRQITRGAPIDDIVWMDETSLRFNTYQPGL